MEKAGGISPTFSFKKKKRVKYEHNFNQTMEFVAAVDGKNVVTDKPPNTDAHCKSTTIDVNE